MYHYVHGLDAGDQWPKAKGIKQIALLAVASGSALTGRWWKVRKGWACARRNAGVHLPRKSILKVAAMYKITVNKSISLIDVKLAGMMTIEEVGRYITDLKRAFVHHRLKVPYRMIIDVTGCPIQRQDVVLAMGQHMATMPKAGAIGVVVGSSLTKMQVRRLFVQPYARITGTYDEAHAWVVCGTEPPSA